MTFEFATKESDKLEIYNNITVLTNTIVDDNLCKLVSYCINKYKDLMISRRGSFQNHHMYEGGFIVHTWNTLLYCIASLDFKLYDRDIVIASAILHDFGKLIDVSYVDEYSKDYSQLEELITHKLGGGLMVFKEFLNVFGIGASTPPFEDSQYRKCFSTVYVVAHHGMPTIRDIQNNKPEGIVVSLFDALDASKGDDVLFDRVDVEIGGLL